MINHVFRTFSAVQVYGIVIFICIFGHQQYITNSQCDLLPVGLIAQLAEHCTGIVEVMGSNPEVFLQVLISQLLKFCT